MSEYWKSTPSYWCKFCAIYVRDTGLERKNHEASNKHQNNIQRSLRTLHKDREREEREKQRAKDEVARLNGLVGGSQKSGSSSGPKITGVKDVTPHTVPVGTKIDPAAERRARAEQLLALGVKLPEQLEREVLGVTSWQTVLENVVQDGGTAQERNLADILKQEQEAGESKAAVSLGAGELKRKIDDEEDPRDEEAPPKIRKAWGSTLKKYPGDDGEGDDDGDLDALLSGVTGKKKAADVNTETKDELKREDSAEENPPATNPDMHDQRDPAVKQENGGENEVVAPVLFKKRKGKR